MPDALSVGHFLIEKLYERDDKVQYLNLRLLLLKFYHRIFSVSDD